MTENDYPRVLIVNGEPLGASSATGITLSNLFSTWPRDSIAQVYTAKVDVVDLVYPNSWRLSNRDLWFMHLFRKTRSSKKRFSGEIVEYPKIFRMNDSVANSMKIPFHRRLIVPLLDLIPYKLPGVVLAEIIEFRPQVIYSMLGNIRLTRLTQHLAQRLMIPVVPHFMDDWISTYAVPGKSSATSFHRALLQRALKRLFEHVPFGLSIGEAMASEYRTRFGCRFEAFMNPVLVLQKPSAKAILPRNRVVKFVYIGGLHLARWKNLQEIGDVLLRLREEGVCGALYIYAPVHDTELYGPVLSSTDVVFACGTVAPEKVQDVLLDYDVAVHVESFEESVSQYTRLSVSTKIPQYLASALPILAYGPEHVASCRYVRDHGCGLVVGNSGPQLLVGKIRELITGEQLRHELGQQGWMLARMCHEVNRVRGAFREILAEAASKGCNQSV